MKFYRMSGFGSSELPPSVTVRSAISAPGSKKRSEPTGGAPCTSGQTAGDSAQQVEQTAAAAVMGSKTYNASGPLIERYAKLRYDKESRTIMIQIIDAANGEVVSEIPPDAWEKNNPGVHLPKGMLVEEEQ